MFRTRTPPIVCVSSIDWGFLWQRQQTFMTGFAERGHRVFYIESTGFRNPRWSGSLIRRFTGRLRGGSANGNGAERHPNIRIVPPWILPPTTNLNRSLNRSFLVRRLATTLFGAGLRPPFLLYAYLPTSTTLALGDRLKPAWTVYDCCSNYSGHEEAPEDLDRLERALLRRSDAVIVDSGFLREKIRGLHPRLIQIHHGVSFERFHEARADGPVRTIRRLGFFGGIDERIDWTLFEGLGEDGVEVEMIGPVRTDISEARRMGIRFRPAIPPAELPVLLRTLDAFVIPYRLDRFTSGILPAKLFECFATGRPTFVTPLPSYKPFEPWLHIVRGAAELREGIRGIGRKENATTVSRRYAIARENSTDANFAELYGHVGALFRQVQKEKP